MSLSKETRQILDMLAAGKINAEEAQRLMERLEGSSSSAGQGRTAAPEVDRIATTTVVAAAPSQGRGGANPKYLRIVVNSTDGDVVNIRVPLQIVRAGLKLSAVLPQDARDKIKESGIDLSKLNELHGEELIDALRELSIDVDASDGDTVRIFCE